MSLAAETRDAVRDVPFLLDALRAGIVNYAAAARVLDVADDTDAVATALRRFAEDLPPIEPEASDARVTMHGNLEQGVEDGLLQVGDATFGAGDGRLTGVLAVGDVDAAVLERALSLLRTHGVDVDAAGVGGGALVVVVGRRDGATAVRLVERSLDAVPTV